MIMAKRQFYIYQLSFDNLTNYTGFLAVPAKTTIYVKSDNEKAWMLDKANDSTNDFKNVNSNNVIVKKQQVNL